MKTTRPDLQATPVFKAFERIHREQMAGLPLLNKALHVTVLGFQSFEGRTLGMLITPWMMSLLLFPGQQDDWQPLALGSKHVIGFPSGEYRFMINRIEGLDVCQMHSLHSPMHAFPNQEAAITEATNFLNQLLVVPAGGVQADPVDEELLGKILRGEKVPEMDKDGKLLPERPSRLRNQKPNLTETT